MPGDTCHGCAYFKRLFGERPGCHHHLAEQYRITGRRHLCPAADMPIGAETMPAPINWEKLLDNGKTAIEYLTELVRGDKNNTQIRALLAHEGLTVSRGTIDAKVGALRRDLGIRVKGSRLPTSDPAVKPRPSAVTPPRRSRPEPVEGRHKSPVNVVEHHEPDELEDDDQPVADPELSRGAAIAPLPDPEPARPVADSAIDAIGSQLISTVLDAQGEAGLAGMFILDTGQLDRFNVYRLGIDRGRSLAK